jgi:hypothetical protein
LYASEHTSEQQARRCGIARNQRPDLIRFAPFPTQHEPVNLPCPLVDTRGYWKTKRKRLQ